MLTDMELTGWSYLSVGVRNGDIHQYGQQDGDGDPKVADNSSDLRMENIEKTAKIVQNIISSEDKGNE